MKYSYCLFYIFILSNLVPKEKLTEPESLYEIIYYPPKMYWKEIKFWTFTNL